MDNDKWFVDDSSEPEKKVRSSFERDSKGRFLLSEGDRRRRGRKKDKSNKRLNEFNYDLRAEFSKRRLKVIDFLRFCEDFYPYCRQKVTADLDRSWAEISLQDKIIYYLFLQYIDK